MEFKGVCWGGVHAGHLILTLLLASILAGWVSATPSVTINLPEANANITDTTPEVNATSNETVTFHINWDSEGNISAGVGTGYNVSYGQTASNTSNLLALHLDEGTGSVAVDSSSYDNNGDITNGTWVTGKLGNAIDFNGSGGYVEVPHSEELDINGDKITVLAWIKPAEKNDYGTVVSKGGTQYEIRWTTNTDARTLTFLIGDVSWQAVDSTDYLPLNVWTCVAGVADGSEISIWFNGTQDNSATQTENINGDDLTLRIGSRGGATASLPWNGSIDEVAIYNISLSQAEIQDWCDRTMPDGAHTVAVCVNNTNGEACLTHSFTVDTVAPTVDLNTQDQLNTSDSTPTLSYTPHDTNIWNCSIYTNTSGSWQLNTTNFDETDGVQNSFTLASTPDGTYLWNVKCWDYAGNNAFNSSNRTFTVDTVAPTVSISSPISETYTYNKSISLTYTTSDATTQVEEVWYQLDGGSNVTLTGNTTLDFSVGKHTLKVGANDTVDNVGEASVSFTITLPLNIQLVYPSNSLETTKMDWPYTYNITTNDTSVDNCSFYWGSSESGMTVKLTDTSIILDNGGENQFLYTHDAGGTFYWGIKCYNSWGNVSWSSENWTIKFITGGGSVGGGGGGLVVYTTTTTTIADVTLVEPEWNLTGGLNLTALGGSAGEGLQMIWMGLEDAGKRVHTQATGLWSEVEQATGNKMMLVVGVVVAAYLLLGIDWNSLVRVRY